MTRLDLGKRSPFNIQTVWLLVKSVYLCVCVVCDMCVCAVIFCTKYTFTCEKLWE